MTDTEMLVLAIVFLILGCLELSTTLTHARAYNYKLSLKMFGAVIYWFVAGIGYLIYLGAKL